MNKNKFKYNPHTLTFEQVESPFLKKLANLAIRFGLSLILSAIVFFIYSYFLDTPKEKILKRENANLSLQFELLEKKIAESIHILNEIQQRDNQIYRSIFEADTIPSTLRAGGFGGANHYEKFEGFRTSEILISTATLLDQLTWRTYMQSKSFDEVIDLAKNKEQMIQSVPAIQPVSVKDMARISDYFGFRRDPFTKEKKVHHGIDFVGPKGAPIYATGNGKVINAEFSFFGYGNVVVIDHGFGFKTRYAHLQKIDIKVGDEVTRGQIIGSLGNSGRSTGPHLHYEVLLRNKPVDPMNYFNDMSPEIYDSMVRNNSQLAMD
jgi:murein DD-endopeptidase MepM/ murein hydrolase activator NlpD